MDLFDCLLWLVALRWAAIACACGAAITSALRWWTVATVVSGFTTLLGLISAFSAIVFVVSIHQAPDVLLYRGAELSSVSLDYLRAAWTIPWLTAGGVGGGAALVGGVLFFIARKRSPKGLSLLARTARHAGS